MVDNNNVFILFEEIKTAMNGIKSKVEELPNVASQQQQTGNNKLDLSPIKEVVMETTKPQSEEIKGLLAKQWKAYAQLSSQNQEIAGRTREATRAATAGAYPQAQLRHQIKQGVLFCCGNWCSMRFLPVGQYRAMAVQAAVCR